MPSQADLQTRSVHAIRILAAETVQKAKSGHPGLPMGAAPLAYTLWKRHLRHNPANPKWFNRDRFILSGGHGSTLLYSLLYLSGYPLSIADLQQYRQWGSRTAGHPECNLTPGVEITTGPLGQGFANGVGMAIAEKHLAALFNRPDLPIIDHYVYAIVTDGDLMEGITSEAASLAGHLRLSKLIYLYDDNHMTIEGGTELAFTEDRALRFQAYGWQVLHVEDANDVDAVDVAIRQAKLDPRPSIIFCRTILGYGLPNKQNTPKAHGEPPGEGELKAAKANLGWPQEPAFYVPEDVLAHFREAVEQGSAAQAAWDTQLEAYKQKYPRLTQELFRRMESCLPEGWDQDLPFYSFDTKGIATRAASGQTINRLACSLPELVGGSADLAPSNNTWMACTDDFQADHPQGRNFHFGIREHAMAAIVNGLARYGGLIPFGATYLVFSDYMKPAIRLAALSHLPSIWVFTHDSIGVGEDGPTHQPVEQVLALRSIPGLVTIRPADANETVEAWKYAISHRDGPVALILSRQATPILDRGVYAPASGLQRGAYILKDWGEGRPRLILMASGAEVNLVVKAGEQLARAGTPARVVSFPSWELFKAQSRAYRQVVLPPEITLRLAVEAGVSIGWERWAGDRGLIIAVDSFGASAPGPILMEKFGFSLENVLAQARALLEGQ